MKIKKPMSTATAAPAPTGGAAIADRFKLEPVAGAAEKSSYKGPSIGKTSSMIALIAGVVCLGLAGGLTYLLLDHFKYLMSA